MLKLTDPTSRASWYSHLDGSLGRLIKDPRDLPFVVLSWTALLMLVPFASYLFFNPEFPWWLGAGYLALLFLGFIDKYTLMLHCTSHRPLYKPQYGWMNHIIPVVLAPFMGQTPYTYYVHHIGMHHRENNLEPDLSSTLHFQRDSFLGFLAYYGRFVTLGIVELTRYHASRKRTKLARMAFLGEMSWILGVVALCFWHWQATLVVFIIPLMLMRFMMMSGNWVQHAFIDPTDAANPYKNSITCINVRYNRRAYNDGYHAGHHVKASRHWTEMPGDLLANLDTYRDNDAVIFEGVDYFQIWGLLMTKQYKSLAKRLVDLHPTPRTEEEKIAFLKSRLRKLTPEERAPKPSKRRNAEAVAQSA